MISQVCPQEIRAENHKKKNNATWKSKEWKEKRAAFLTGTVCIWCKKPAQTPHHPTDEYYGKPGYIDLHLSGCMPMCNWCHRAVHRGLVLCPKCCEHYMGALKEMCKYCDPEIKAREEAREIRQIQVRKAQRVYRQTKYIELKRARG